MVLRVHRQENGLRTGTDAEDLVGRAQSVQERHPEIQDGDVRAALLRRADRLAAVGDLRGHGESFPLQQGPQALPNDQVVIGEENSSRHRPPPRVRR